MSSTNRGGVRNDKDYYITPPNEIKKFLDNFMYIDRNSKILDPCAGGDILHPMSYPKVLSEYGYINIDTVDIREDSLADVKADYLKYNCSEKYDVVITNPPFMYAKEIIEKALCDVKDGGYVIMLLRISFLESGKRFDFWRNNMPSYIYLHHRRMSFTNDGKTDSDAYAHYVWIKGENPEFAQLKVI